MRTTSRHHLPGSWALLAHLFSLDLTSAPLAPSSLSPWSPFPQADSLCVSCLCSVSVSWGQGCCLFGSQHEAFSCARARAVFPSHCPSAQTQGTASPCCLTGMQTEGSQLCLNSEAGRELQGLRSVKIKWESGRAVALYAFPLMLCLNILFHSTHVQELPKAGA